MVIHSPRLIVFEERLLRADLWGLAGVERVERVEGLMMAMGVRMGMRVSSNDSEAVMKLSMMIVRE